MVKGILFFEIGALIALWVFTLYELRTTGPYTRWYNERLFKIASEANLIGDREEKVEEVLGKPDAIDVWSDDGEKDYIYAPFPHFPAAVVQVHCKDGKVMGIDLYDD